MRRNLAGSMRVPSSSCLLLLLSGQALAYLDEANEAIVIEGMT
jgi:hypothetical protein